jgi:protein phosphatase
MVEAGELTEAEAVSHPRRSVLLRAVVPGADVDPDLAQHTVREGDRLLVATDGLHIVVGVDQVAAVLRDARTPTDAVAQHLGLAHAAGAPDNVAVAVAVGDVTGRRRDHGRDVAAAS